MSRLYGRAFDIYQISNYLKTNKIPGYKEENKKTSIDELIESSKIINIYFPESAIDFLSNNPIHIAKSPFLPRNMSSFPTKNDPNATIYFKGVNFKEEHKRELAFFQGSVLSMVSPDELPKNDDLPCEYGDILPLLFEYLYLKENGKEDRFILKHLNTLKFNAERYSRVYESHQRQIVNSQNLEYEALSEKQQSKIDNFNDKCDKIFLENTLTMLVPYSSLDGVLQLIDKIDSKEKYKELIKELYENKDNNRQNILNDKNIESYGYKRLRKEIDFWSKKNE